MASIPAAVAAFLGTAIQLGNCFAEPIKRKFNYLFCFDSNIQNLRDEAPKLEHTRSALQNMVTTEENNAQVIDPRVKAWFDDVVGIQAKNTEIEAEITTFRQNGCFAVKSRYSLGKKVKTTAEAMKDLREEGSKFTIIAQPPPPAAVAAPIPLGSNIFEFESRKQIEEEIIVSLKDENVNKLGICGMGGVGKTTMAKRIMHRVREEHLFDEIVMAVVSQKPDRLGIQGVIAKKLGLELKDKESVECRAVDLHDRLTAGTKRSLIVVDDVWDVLNLEELGIPCDSGCKILLTSRDKDIFQRMKVENVSAVRVLCETEAWDLFRSEVGSCIEQENAINAIAQQVVKECKGLPIALVTVGVALKDEVNIRRWKHALDQLKSANPNHMPEVIEAVYRPLRFSYESLKSVDHKSLFLLCCLFPEDCNIHLENLAIYAMGLRMFGDITSLEETRETVVFLVKKLKSCFLLLEGDWYHENYVKMHDVVRDVARFIASDEMLINCDDCTWIAPYTKKRFGLYIGSAVYPNPHLLINNWSRDKRLEIGDDFFEGMEELNVFSATYSSLQRLPKTIKLMKNLKTLILVGCGSLESISVIGELVNLEILICRQCELIECLPIEMEGIDRLRLLELSDCRNLKTIAPGIISNQKGLEELIVEYFDDWEAADEESRERKNASLSELEQLSSLSHLKIKIKDYRVAAGHKGLSPNMVKYDITIGDQIYLYYSEEGFEKVLKVNLAGNISLGKWIHECVRSVEYMWLEGSNDSNLNFGTAHNMRLLTLKECSAVKKLVNMRSSSAAVFTLLEHLMLEELSELEVICYIDGPLQSNSFQNLKELQLIRLPRLKHLWNSGISPNQQNVISSFNKLSTIYISECHGLRSLFSLARGSWFAQLKSLEIWECDMMEQVLSWDEKENQTNIHIPLVFPILKKLKLYRLPRLTSFSKGIFQSIEFPLLEEMEVQKCPLLKGLVSSATSDNHDDVSNIFFFKVKFDRLTEPVVGESVEIGRNLHQFPVVLFAGLCKLRVSGFKEIKGLFSLTMTQSGCLLRLEELEISDCEIMEQIILWNEEESQRNIHITPFPKLKLLILDSLPRLTSFCKRIKGIVEFSLPNKLEIRNCPVLLESCVSMSISSTGPPHDADDTVHLFCKSNKVEFGNLKALSIGNYDSMRNWCGQISIDFFAVLCRLEVSCLKGMKSLFLFSIARNLQNLVQLDIRDCEEMVKVIEDEEDDALQISLFPNLKRVGLCYLKKLKSFCEWRCTLQLPKLEHLEIIGCDVMDEFTLGALNTPNLKRILIDFHDSSNEVNKALEQQRLRREKQLETLLEESSSVEADSTN